MDMRQRVWMHVHDHVVGPRATANVASFAIVVRSAAWTTRSPDVVAKHVQYRLYAYYERFLRHVVALHRDERF